MTQTIAVKELTPCPWNPRMIDQGRVATLAESVREVGLLQPLLVRPRGSGYEVIAGHRRLEACKAAGLREVPCLVREMSDEEVVRCLLVENLERDDLTLFEEGMGVRRLAEVTRKPVAEVARMLNRKATWVQLRLDLWTLPDPAREAVRKGRMGAGVAGLLAKVPDADRATATQQALDMMEDGIAPEVVEGMIHAEFLAIAQHRENWLRHVGRFVKEAGFLLKPCQVVPVADVAKAWEEMFFSFGQLKGEWVELPNGWPAHRYRNLQRVLRAGGSLVELAARHGVPVVLAPAWQDATGYVAAVEAARLDVALSVAEDEPESGGGSSDAREESTGEDVTHEEEEEEEDGEWDAALVWIRETLEWIEEWDDSEITKLEIGGTGVVLPKLAILAALHGAANALREGGEG